MYVTDAYNLDIWSVIVLTKWCAADASNPVIVCETARTNLFATSADSLAMLLETARMKLSASSAERVDISFLNALRISNKCA